MIYQIVLPFRVLVVKLMILFQRLQGQPFECKVDLGMAAPSFNDISRGLTVLLSNKSLIKFDPSLNGLGLNNVLYVSMLLRLFEDRIEIGKTPGQLLLFEEPEAHLHPQLQIALFKTLLHKPFQTIATTHSTHINSQVPLRSIVVLTDDGTPATASCVPALTPRITEKNVADLERYLDAQGTETPGGELADCPGDLGADLVLVGGQIEDDLRCALRDLELTPVRSSNLGLRAFMDGVEGLEVEDLVTRDGLAVLQATEHRQVDRVLVLGARPAPPRGSLARR